MLHFSDLTRGKAFLIHFTISLVIFLTLLYFILFHWYPQPFFSTDGGWQGIRIIAGVDLVLGPLLTLIVFKPGKPGLKFDLSMIALFQITALVWGTWITYNERPFAIVFTEDRFTSVPAYQILETGVDKTFLNRFGNKTPVIIYSRLPEGEELYKVMRTSLQQRKPLYLFTEYYQPFDSGSLGEISAKSLDMANYMKSKPEDKAILESARQRYQDKNRYRIIPLYSRYAHVLGVFELDSAQIVDVINSEPDRYLLEKRIKSPTSKKTP